MVVRHIKMSTKFGQISSSTSKTRMTMVQNSIRIIQCH